MKNVSLGLFTSVTYSDATTFDGVVIRASVPNSPPDWDVVFHVVCDKVRDAYPRLVGDDPNAFNTYVLEFRTPDACGTGCGQAPPACSASVDNQLGGKF